MYNILSNKVLEIFNFSNKNLSISCTIETLKFLMVQIFKKLEILNFLIVSKLA